MKKIIKWTAAAVLFLGIIWFMLPLFRHGFGVGSVFGISVCVIGILLLMFYTKLSKKKGLKQAFVRFVSFFYAVGLVWCVYLTVLMNTAAAQLPPEGSDVIVLGAQVHQDGRLSLSLSQRVSKAAEYLTANPDSVCITTGGQGNDEPLPEAHAERSALIEKGIDQSRIFVEDKSRNTRQNFENALVIAEDEKLADSFAVVTQDFHMFRALKLGEAVGLDVYALPVKSDSLMYPGYYGRELLSLTKWHVQELFSGG